MIGNLPDVVPEPSIVVHKGDRTLELRSRGDLVHTYKIGLGIDPLRPKEKQGDFATPEGAYYVCTRNPRSRFELSLGLSYPGPLDAERGLAAGLISPGECARIVAACAAGATPPWNTRLGGEIMIHGHGAHADWTAGCIALDDADIRAIYRVIPLGTPVEIHA